jgi:uncharacterized protein with HEPN domain
MQPRDASYLLDILKAAQLIEDFVAGMDKADFDSDLLRGVCYPHSFSGRKISRMRRSN